MILNRVRGARVLVKREPVETQTKSGILLAAESQKRTDVGSVVLVGEDVADLHQGDKVLWDHYATMLPVSDDEFILDESDVLAVL